MRVGVLASTFSSCIWKTTARIGVVPDTRTPRMDPIVRHRGNIILLHFVGQMPLAGIAWQAMHYLVGLEQLGYKAWYIEDSGTNPFDPRANSVAMECEYNVRYLRR